MVVALTPKGVGSLLFKFCSQCLLVFLLSVVCMALLISPTPSLPALIHFRILSCSDVAFRLSLKLKSGLGS